jgi:4-hydroxy-3-polyprenylbenzoate decarboxylase
LFIAAKEDNKQLNIHHIEEFFTHVLERVDWNRDLHFQTNTSIDTLDYSGESLNSGSKVVIAAAGSIKRDLIRERPTHLLLPSDFVGLALAMPGVVCISGAAFTRYEQASGQINSLGAMLETQDLKGIAMIVVCDNSEFCARNMNNFVWTTFTKSNPSHDIYGVGNFTRFKHWGCTGPLIIDARKKPFHAPDLLLNPEVEKQVDQLFTKGHSLYGLA